MILYLGRLLPTFLTEISTKKPKLRRSIRKGKCVFEELGEGILEVLPDGYGFLRAENCLPGSK